MANTGGLRERKKTRTRREIAEAARRLFGARGFEEVTVSEVAAAAEVSEATVFNYFPTKEDLLYSGLEEFESQLLDAIRERPSGESALAAFGRFVNEPRGLLASDDPEVIAHHVATTRVIEESPALMARERQIFARFTDSLAELLREETTAEPDDIEPWVAANAIIGVHRSLVGYARRQILAGTRNPLLKRRVSAQAKHALETLEAGLRAYAEKGDA